MREQRIFNTEKTEKSRRTQRTLLFLAKNHKKNSVCSVSSLKILSISSKNLPKRWFIISPPYPPHKCGGKCAVAL